MAKILVYNPASNRVETYYRSLSSQMPYARKMSVNEFQGFSKSSLVWTDKRAMEAWNKLRSTWGKPIKIGAAFKRMAEGGHAGQSQHYAGVAFDIGQDLPSDERDKLRDLAVGLGVFTYVEPKVLTPTWVHVDKRVGPPACSTGGYPVLKPGNRGNYVAILQDGLYHLGFLGTSENKIDGIFGKMTKDAVMKFQKANDLTSDGVVGCSSWQKLSSLVLAMGLKT